MEIFDLPKALDGDVLQKELSASGVKVAPRAADSFGIFEIDGKLILDIDKKDRSVAETIVANHKG